LTVKVVGTHTKSTGVTGVTSTLAECLQVVLIEEWEHRRYAEQDLDALAEAEAN
jgi:hypothetical protein